MQKQLFFMVVLLSGVTAFGMDNFVPSSFDEKLALFFLSTKNNPEKVHHLFEPANDTGGDSINQTFYAKGESHALYTDNPYPLYSGFYKDVPVYGKAAESLYCLLRVQYARQENTKNINKVEINIVEVD